MVGLMSAAGLVGFLSEPDTQLQIFALRTANDGIAYMWTELAGSVGQIEALYEDESFPERELAALLASKIYYHLQEYDESMIFALAAGKLFDIERQGEFEDTIIGKCVDTYISLSATNKQQSVSDATPEQPPQLTTALSNTANGSANTAASLASPTTPFSHSTLPSKSLLSREDSSPLDSTTSNRADSGIDGAQSGGTVLGADTRKSLQAVIRRIFERCFQEGAYRQVVGIAVEARNLDILRESVTRAGEDGDNNSKSRGRTQANRRDELMEYLLDICMNIIQERVLREEILQLVLDMLVSYDAGSPDYFSIAKCIVYLNQHSLAATNLKKLVERDDPRALSTAFQICFDLYDNGSQDFLTKVMEELPQTDEQQSEFSHANGQATAPNTGEDSQESDALLSQIGGPNGASSTSTLASRAKNPVTDEQKKVYSSIRDILTGSKSLEYNLEFLFSNNQADRKILKKLKDSLEARNSIFHSAVTFANAFMNSGTTGDWFFRENMDWVGKANNWSKFSVTAALGVIHRGNIGQGRKLLDPYLRDNSSGGGSTYSKGGALFGLGLIYTNHGQHVVDYLYDQLKNASSEPVIQHGAALGIGVAGMATEAEHVVEELKQAMYSDSAISGQAAGLGIGLVLLGSGDIKALESLITYAHETEHDKTVRGIALGMALIMYARQEAADELINGLLEDPDPTLRYGGIMTIAMAYCGSSSNKAVRKLLHVAVSDVNDDVRRVAVMSLGFVLFRKPGSVPRMVELLAESYNPHVRYGATMALGIACAGTGLEEAIDLLEPMMKDSTDFVRQGTLIALSMIMVQQNEAMNPKVVTIRKHLMKMISDRHEDAMAKFGAALAIGIIDAGGRNCTIGLQTQTGNLNMPAIVGMAIFTQYWYWFPLSHFLSLSFTPTTVVGVDQDLEIPQAKLFCNSRPSLFEYPPNLEVKQEEAPEKVKTAVLSTTAQAKRRRAAKDKANRSESMDVDPTPTTPKAPTTDEADADKMDTDDKKPEKADKEAEDETPAKDTDAPSSPSKPSAKPKPEKEKTGFEMNNLSRVLPSQLKYTSFPETGRRYLPVKKVPPLSLSLPTSPSVDSQLTNLKPTNGVLLLTDTTPTEPKLLIDRKIKKPTPRPASSDQNTSAAGGAVPVTPQNPLGQPITEQERQGSAELASVLNAVDEDDEGGVEAEAPPEFEWESDGEGTGE
ncbi:MAG: proteasome regulatory particle base subunit [Chrysothrix sp. TS-e1954]|nr:MAG: proteasome regulatory particle base subunit [Chrysothrix sp. TS-e1954]